MLKRDITATFAGNFVAMILSLGTVTILTRVLGPINMGLFGLAILIPNIAATFCILGQDTVNSAFAGLYKDKRSSLFQQSLIITLFGTIISTLAICAFYFWLPIKKGQFEQLSYGVVWLTCLITPALLLFSTTISLVKGVGRISAAAIINTGDIFIYCHFYNFCHFKGVNR